MDHLKITVLVENTAAFPSLTAEHGFACWVEAGNHSILFDTGQSDAVTGNAKALGIDLREADAVVLSHGHYDHTGGLSHVADLAPDARIYAHPAAFEPKFARESNGDTREIGCRCVLLQDRLVPTPTFTAVVPGIEVTGEIPRIEANESASTRFCSDPQGRRLDPMPDDQALVIRARQGFVVLLGCAHAGVINTIRHVQDQHPGNRIHAVIGGMHLKGADSDRITWTFDVLHEFGISCIAPAHCTGDVATALAKECFPDAYLPCGGGTVLTFDL